MSNGLLKTWNLGIASGPHKSLPACDFLLRFNFDLQFKMDFTKTSLFGKSKQITFIKVEDADRGLSLFGLSPKSELHHAHPIGDLVQAMQND